MALFLSQLCLISYKYRIAELEAHDGRRCLQYVGYSPRSRFTRFHLHSWRRLQGSQKASGFSAWRIACCDVRYRIRHSFGFRLLASNICSQCKVCLLAEQLQPPRRHQTVSTELTRFTQASARLLDEFHWMPLQSDLCRRHF